MQGEEGQGWNHSKHGLAWSPEPGMPRQDGPAAGAGQAPPAPEPLSPQGTMAWGRERPGGGQGPREIVLSGCVPEKGLQTPAQQGRETLPGWGREQHQLLVGPGPAAG